MPFPPPTQKRPLPISGDEHDEYETLYSPMRTRAVRCSRYPLCQSPLQPAHRKREMALKGFPSGPFPTMSRLEQEQNLSCPCNRYAQTITLSNSELLKEAHEIVRLWDQGDTSGSIDSILQPLEISTCRVPLFRRIEAPGQHNFRRHGPSSSRDEGRRVLRTISA